MSSRVFLCLFAVAVTALPAAHADSSPLANHPTSVTGLELSHRIQSLDSASVRDAGLYQADAIRRIPDEMRAQGVNVTPADEARFDGVADRLAADASSPGFKKRVANAMKHVGHGLGRVGIDALKGIGYAGTGAFSVSLAPLIFGTNFTTSLILGHGVIGAGPHDNLQELLGIGGGIASFYYVYSGLTALGYTFSGTVIASSMGVVLVNQLLCGIRAKAGGKTELNRYCNENDKIMLAILGHTATAGSKVGAGIHHALVKAARIIAKPFHHPRKR